MLATATKHAAAQGQGIITSGTGRPRSCTTASAATRRRCRGAAAASDTVTRRPSMWALPELVEAAARAET